MSQQNLLKYDKYCNYYVTFRLKYKKIRQRVYELLAPIISYILLVYNVNFMNTVWCSEGEKN